MKYLLIPIILTLVFIGGIKVGVNNAPAKITTITEDCPNWICTTRIDSRSVKEYVEQCKPEQATNGTEYGYFCTSDKYPEDKFSQLPKDWTFVK